MSINVNTDDCILDLLVEAIQIAYEMDEDPTEYEDTFWRYLKKHYSFNLDHHDSNILKKPTLDTIAYAVKWLQDKGELGVGS